MPRDITHIILADEAADIIKNKDIFNHPDAFHMGCLADDSFLYSLSPQLASKLHGGEDSRMVILEMMDEQKKEKDPSCAAEKKSFIYGYLCHMAADVAYHPLIYSISGAHQVQSDERQKMLAKASHRYVETWLDLHLMREKKLSFKNFRPFRKIVRNFAMRLRMDDFFTDCVQKALKAKKYTWGDNFDLQAQFHNSMMRQLFVDKITQNQTVAKMLRKLDRGLDGKLKPYTSGFYDFSGDIPQRLTAGSFVHPVTGKVIKKSLKNLEYDAIKTSVKFIRAVDDYMQSGNRDAFLRNVPNYNWDTGLVDSTSSDFNKNITPDLVSVEVKMWDDAKKRQTNVPTLLKGMSKSR